MGILSSRQLPGAEEADVVSNHAYKYPPRSGSYFGTHFIMGGERFDTPQPEAYLFGENSDLNFLGSRPTPFPYPPPQPNEPTKTLKSLVNIRKESVRFVRCTKASKLADDGGDTGSGKALYNVEFTFDCDVRCAITIYYFCTEEVTPTGAVYVPRDPSMTSQTFYYRKGANQQFCQSTHVFDPSKYNEDDLSYNPDKEIIPIAIHCVVEEGAEGIEQRQSHTTIGVVEKHLDGTYVLKALKQKLFVDGLCYLLQEIYGIENKNIDTKPGSDEETEDGGSECVICMSEVRDTLILPCRHLCLCNSCADSLRYQANNCPICRAPFRALLQIRALQKISGAPTLLSTSPPDGSMENIPPGYEPVSLIEALNGPCQMRVSLAPPTPQPARLSPAIASPDGDSACQAAEALNRSNLERATSCSGKRHSKSLGGKDSEAKSPRDRTLAQPCPPEFRMSVLLAREEDATGVTHKMAASSPLLGVQQSAKVNGGEDNSKRTSDVEDVEDCEGAEAELEAEGDSEQERLSPLLTHKIANGTLKTNGASPCATSGGATATATDKCAALHLDTPSLQHIDDTDTDDQELSTASAPAVVCVVAASSPIDDSDYFTPEDTTTTILTVPNHVQHDPLLNNSVCHSSVDGTPQRWPLPHRISLPGTPLSQSSIRSSGDSYSSSSSTRQLLAPAMSLVTDTQC